MINLYDDDDNDGNNDDYDNDDCGDGYDDGNLANCVGFGITVNCSSQSDLDKIIITRFT